MSRRRLSSGVDLTVVLVFFLDGGDVSDGRVQPVLVEPVHPGKGCEFEVVGAVEGAVDLDAFVLAEADDGLGRALSYESPTVPIEATAPTSARRSESRRAVYRDPASEC